MNLLIITQKIDKEAPILGFFHRWVKEFAKHCNRLMVICLEEGEHNLPENVSVYSLGKESGESRLKYLKNFFHYIFSLRKQYDTVFVHMNPIYVILGGLFWRLRGKTVALWYTHKTVDIKLRTAEKLAHILFSASETSFRMQTEKVRYVGHGIDTNLFMPDSTGAENEIFTVLTVGRISPVKDYETLLEAVSILQDQTEQDIKLTVVGGPATEEDKQYQKDLHDKAQQLEIADMVNWVGSVSQEEVVSYYQRADVFVNMSKTGSLDKVVLEAMATETPPLTSNKAFQDVFTDNRDKYMFPAGNPAVLADKLARIANADDDEDLNQLRKIVEKEYSVQSLIPKIIAHLQNLFE